MKGFIIYPRHQGTQQTGHFNEPTVRRHKHGLKTRHRHCWVIETTLPFTRRQQTHIYVHLSSNAVSLSFPEDKVVSQPLAVHHSVSRQTELLQWSIVFMWNPARCQSSVSQTWAGRGEVAFCEISMQKPEFCVWMWNIFHKKVRSEEERKNKWRRGRRKEFIKPFSAAIPLWKLTMVSLFFTIFHADKKPTCCASYKHLRNAIQSYK